MKAWHVFDPWDGSLLVFAESRNKARLVGCTAGLYEMEYIDTKAHRASKWDQYADRERVVVENEDLPAGAEPFYDDEAV